MFLRLLTALVANRCVTSAIKNDYAYPCTLTTTVRWNCKCCPVGTDFDQMLTIKPNVGCEGAHISHSCHWISTIDYVVGDLYCYELRKDGVNIMSLARSPCNEFQLRCVKSKTVFPSLMQVCFVEVYFTILEAQIGKPDIQWLLCWYEKWNKRKQCNTDQDFGLQIQTLGFNMTKRPTDVEKY